MSEQNPYEQLGVSEDSSFEEIQAAKSRLCTEYKGDAERIKLIETAYDAVLMDRLKMRQEGRIKVPEGIRFPERSLDPPPNPPMNPVRQAPAWLERFIDTPSKADILLPAGVMAGLSALVILVPTSVQAALILSVGATFYFIYRKEQKLGRAVLLGFVGLFVGLLLGGLIYGLLASQLAGFAAGQDVVASVFMFLVLWLISSFLR